MAGTKSNKSELKEKPWLRAKEALRIFKDDGLTYGRLFELGERGKVNTRLDPANNGWLLYGRRGLKRVLILTKNWVRLRRARQRFPNVTEHELKHYRTHVCPVLRDRKRNPRRIKTKPDPLHVGRYVYWVPDLRKLDEVPTCLDGRIEIEDTLRRSAGGAKAKYGFRRSALTRWREKCNLLPTGKLHPIYRSVRLKGANSSRFAEAYLYADNELALIHRKRRLPRC